MKTISFDELVQGRDSTVRVTEDRLLYAVDLVMVVTGKNRDDSARSIRDLLEETFPQVCLIVLLFYLSSPVDRCRLPIKLFQLILEKKIAGKVHQEVLAISRWTPNQASDLPRCN